MPPREGPHHLANGKGAALLQKRGKQVVAAQRMAMQPAIADRTAIMGVPKRTDSQKARDREAFVKQANVIRRQLRKMEACIVLPHGKFMRQWDKVTLAALMFTAFVTPWEVGLLETSLDPEGLPIYSLNRVVDCIFIVDIMIDFFIPYRDREGLMVFSNRLIARNYALSWFPLDLVASVPYDSLLLVFRRDAPGDGSGADAAGLRMLKMLRLIKLVRILRASRIIKRWESFIGMSHAVMSMFTFLVITLVMAHWLACLWAFVGRSANYHIVLEDDPAWAEAFPGIPYMYQRGKADGSDAYRSHTWIQKAGMYDASPGELYGACLYTALANMFGGYAELSPANYAEFYVQSFMTLVGSCIWAYIISAGCGIISTLDPQGVEFRQTMDELNYFSRYMLRT